jgi:hypothetical protein
MFPECSVNVPQRRELPLGGPVEITVSGSGVGLMQLTTMFHEDASTTQASYSVDTEWSNITGADLVDMQAEACVKAADGALEVSDVAFVHLACPVIGGCSHVLSCDWRTLTHPLLRLADRLREIPEWF